MGFLHDIYSAIKIAVGRDYGGPKIIFHQTSVTKTEMTIHYDYDYDCDCVHCTVSHHC